MTNGAWPTIADFQAAECFGKQAFADKVIADKVAAKMRRSRYGEKMGRAQPYRCTVCRKWHVGQGSNA